MRTDEDSPHESVQNGATTEFTVAYTEQKLKTVIATTEDEAKTKVETNSTSEPTIVDKEPLVKVTFHAQSPTGRVEFPHRQNVFYVPRSDASDEHGELIEDRSYDSDSLREHARAPQWTESWDNPFSITLTEVTREDEPEDS